MGFSIKKKGDKEYVYFYLGSEGPYYLSPKDNLKDSNIDNVLKSLSYVSKKNNDFTQDEIKLIDMLPQVQKDQYISKRISELQSLVDTYTSSLSDSAKQQYTSKGKQTAEDQTRLRLRGQKIKKQNEPNLFEVLQGLQNRGALEYDDKEKKWSLKSNHNKLLKDIKTNG